MAEALRGTGLEVVERDVDASLLALLRAERPACVVPMLHGETGEDGAIREVLELLDVPYVGAPPAACRTAFDKPVAKAVVARAGIRHPGVGVPAARDVPRAGRRRRDERPWSPGSGLPLMVKPARSGSALGLLGRAHRRGAALRDGQRVRLRRRGAARAVRRRASRSPCRSSTTAPGRGRCRPWRSAPTAGSTTTPPATPPGSTEFITPAPLTAELAAEVARVALTRARGARPARRLALGPDRRRRTAGCGSSRSTWLRASPRPRPCPCRSQAAGLDLGTVCASLVQAAVARSSPQE